MAQKEVFPMRSNSFKVSDGKDEKIARGIIRAFLQLSKESEKGPPKDMISNNVPSTPNGTGNGGDTTTSTPQHSKPSKLELTSSARLSPILQSPSVEENVPTTEEPPSCEGTEETAENFSRSSFLRHSAHPNLGSHSEGRNPAMSPDQRLRSNSSVQPFSSVPPDQMDQIPLIIAEKLRDIADRKIQARARADQQGILDRVMQNVPPVNDTLFSNELLQEEFRRQLADILPPHTTETIESTLSAWVEALVMAQTLLQGVAYEDQHSMDDLIQRLEDVVFDLFRTKHALTLVNMCKSNFQRVITCCVNIMRSLSPQLSRIRKVSSASTHSDSPLERSYTSPAVEEESGFFEQSSEVHQGSSNSSTPRRRTSSFSDIFLETLTVATTSVPKGYNHANDD